jgi:hypothetical protein
MALEDFLDLLGERDARGRIIPSRSLAEMQEDIDPETGAYNDPHLDTMTGELINPDLLSARVGGPLDAIDQHPMPAITDVGRTRPTTGMNAPPITEPRALVAPDEAAPSYNDANARSIMLAEAEEPGIDTEQSRPYTLDNAHAFPTGPDQGFDESGVAPAFRRPFEGAQIRLPFPNAQPQLPFPNANIRLPQQGSEITLPRPGNEGTGPDISALWKALIERFTTDQTARRQRRNEWKVRRGFVRDKTGAPV